MFLRLHPGRCGLHCGAWTHSPACWTGPGPRAQGAFLLRSVLDPAWSVRIQDRAPLSLIALLRGQAWLVPDTGDRVALHPGDVAIIRGPDPYTVADDPATPPQVVIHPGQRCTTPEGEDLVEMMEWLGVRTWGNSPAGSTVLLSGHLRAARRGQPAAAEVPAHAAGPPRRRLGLPLIGLLGEEIVRDEPGQEAVLDRLLDLLLIAVLRAWFARPDAEAPAWYRANGDPVVGRALRLLHNNPSHPWTVATLADEVGVSRAALARRFTELVGEPPMTFLTGWRLDLAADLLREPDVTLGAVAHQVGYGSPFALSAAFKRVRGISPQQHRVCASAR